MEQRLDRIEAKLDVVMDKIDTVAIMATEQSVHISRNTKDLEVHIKRTDQLQNEVTAFRSYIKAFHVFMGVTFTVVGLILGWMKIG